MTAWNKRISRRTLLAVGGGLALSRLLGVSIGQNQIGPQIRLGIVIPSRTGTSPVRASIEDFTGEGARMGALLGRDVLGDIADKRGARIDTLLANSPSSEAAYRAAERLVATEEVSALVGGIGEGQAEAVSSIATAAKIPFFNIGDSSDALRSATMHPYTFHVEASSAMYLDALVLAYTQQAPMKWFVVYEHSGTGAAMKKRAETAIARHGRGGEMVGSAGVKREQAIYAPVLNEIAESVADIVLIALEARDQIAFTAQQESHGLAIPVAAFPHAVTQTRDYLAAARHLAPRTNPRRRISLWEATSVQHRANELSSSFASRWGAIMNPTGWAAYQAVNVMLNATTAIGSTEGEDIAKYLVSEGTEFEVEKGPGVSFRPWDNQLRQPLNVIHIAQDTEWRRYSISSDAALVERVEEVPSIEQGIEPTARLDQLGDGPID